MKLLETSQPHEFRLIGPQALAWHEKIGWSDAQELLKLFLKMMRS